MRKRGMSYTFSTITRRKAVSSGDRVFFWSRILSRSTENSAVATCRALLALRRVCTLLTPTFDKDRGVVTVPLPNGEGAKTVSVVSVEAVAAMSECEEHAGQRTLCEVRK